MDLTPAEINWKTDAWNDANIVKAIDDYASVDLLRSAVASLFDKKNKFPTLTQFCPEGAKKIEAQQARWKEEQDKEMRRQGSAIGMRIP